jgi:hypothetical protein
MKDLAHKIFNQVKDKLIINYFNYSEIDNMPCVNFTYHYGIKSWSHQINLAYNDSSVFLFTSSIAKKDELKDYIFSDFGHTAIYKIEVKSASEVVDLLRKYDRFQYKF